MIFDGRECTCHLAGAAGGTGAGNGSASTGNGGTFGAAGSAGANGTPSGSCTTGTGGSGGSVASGYYIDGLSKSNFLVTGTRTGNSTG